MGITLLSLIKPAIPAIVEDSFLLGLMRKQRVLVMTPTVPPVDAAVQPGAHRLIFRDQAAAPIAAVVFQVTPPFTVRTM
jgi:hypothetical protein